MAIEGITIGSERHDKWLVLLFGALEFDGRVQRMIDVIRSIGGDVHVVDVHSGSVASSLEIQGVTRSRIKLPRFGQQVLGHLRMLLVGLRCAVEYRPDVVVAEDYFTTLAGAVAACAVRSRLVYDAHELIVPSPDGQMSFRDRVWYNFERLAVRKADLVVAANEDRARVMAQHYGLHAVPVVMRNIPAVRTRRDSKVDVVSRYPQLRRVDSSDVRIIYQGYLSLDRGVGKLVGALEYLPTGYRLILVGDGPDVERLRQLAVDSKVEDRVLMLGAVPNRSLAAITPFADIGVAVYPFSGLNNIYCSPNKVYEYAQAGIPVVVTGQPPLIDLIMEYGIGAYVREGDGPREYAAAIERVMARGLGSYQDQLDRFLQDHNWEQEAMRMRDVMRSLVAGGDA